MFSKVMSFLLAVLMLVQAVPMNVLAANAVPVSAWQAYGQDAGSNLTQLNNTCLFDSTLGRYLAESSQYNSGKRHVSVNGSIIAAAGEPDTGTKDQPIPSASTGINAGQEKLLEPGAQDNPVLMPEPTTAESGKLQLFAESVSGNITEILQPANKTVAFDCETFAQLQPYLPPQAAVKLEGGSETLLNIEWNENAPSFGGWPMTAIVSGILVLPAEINNPNNLNLQVSMTITRDSLGTCSTPNGYADADFQSLYLFMSRFLSGQVDANDVPVYLAPEEWTGVTWVMKEVQGIETKFVQSINLDGLISKTANAQLEVKHLGELTTITCKNSTLETLFVYGCPKLTSIECQNNQLWSLQLGECPNLVTLNCATNALSIKRLPRKSKLPAGCTYTYAPQTPGAGEMGVQALEYSLDVGNLTPDPGEGYFFRSNSDEYSAPYTTTWKDGQGNVIPTTIIMTTENEHCTFIAASDGSGKTIHSELTHSDFPELTESSPAVNLPPYGQQIRLINLTPQGGGNIYCDIDYVNHRVNIYPEDVTDFTNVAYTYKIASSSTSNLDLSGTFDITADIQITITDQGGNQQLWTIGREQSEENVISSFAIAEDPAATIEIRKGIAAVYVGLSSKTIPLTSLTPQIGTSPGATVSPVTGAAQDFTQPLTYTVTAESGAAKAWKIYVSYKDGECTCDKSKVILPDQTITMQPRSYEFPVFLNAVNGAEITQHISIERYPCFVPGHDGEPVYGYRLGSINEAGAYIGKDIFGREGIGFLNPGKFSLIASASLNGKTLEAAEETVIEVLPNTNNFKLLTTSFDVKRGDNITVKWNDDSLDPDKTYTLYYTQSLSYGDPYKELCKVKGSNEVSFAWPEHYSGYISVRTDLPDRSYLICSAPVKVTFLKLSVEVSLPRLEYGGIGCFNNKDYVIDYKITGSDYAAVKDQVKIYARVTRQGGPGESIPVTCETNDTQIIIRKDQYPVIDLSQGMPLFYLTVSVSSLDGSIIHNELAGYYEFYIFKLPDWASNAAPYDYKGTKLDAEHPLLLGPGFLDLSTITIAELVENGENPCLYACDFEVLDKGAANPYLGSGWDYQISDESVAEFYYRTNYAIDGTPIKFPRGILAKKDGECSVTISDSYTGTVLTFPVKVSLAQDKLVWFQVINGQKYHYPFSNFKHMIGPDGVVANPKVTYFTKNGTQKTVQGDDQGFVIIYDPDGITGKVEIKAAIPNEPLKYFWYSTTLDMSTLFKSTAWGSYDWLIRNGTAPRYQLIPLYIYDLEIDNSIVFRLQPNEDLNRIQGIQDYRQFHPASLQHMQARVYVVNARGEEVFAAPASVSDNGLKVTWNDTAKIAMLEDDAKVIVEIVPLPDAPGVMTYSIVGTDHSTLPTLEADGKTLKFVPTSNDYGYLPARLTVRATHKETQESFDFVLYVNVFKDKIPTGYPYPATYYLGGTYTIDLDTIFTKPVIQSTLFERTAAQLRQEGKRSWIDNKRLVQVDIPVNVGRKNDQENTVASVLLRDQTGKVEEASSRTTPLGITPDQPMTMIAYIKSSAEDAISGNDYTIEAYKNNDLLTQESVKSYYLGSGNDKMKYKWYVSTMKLDANLVPPQDYFKPKYKLSKADGSTQTVEAKFEAVNPDGLMPDPKPPASLPFTGKLSSGAFNPKILGNVNLPFDLPANLQVQVAYDFSKGNLEGTFRMLVGYGRKTESENGDRFAADYSEAVSAIGNIRYGGSSVGSRFNAQFTALGYVTGIVRYVDGNYKMIATGGGIMASAGFDYSWSHNAVVGFVPVYYGIDIGAYLTMDAAIDAYNFQDAQAINGDFEIAFRTVVEIAGYIKISGGIGFDVGIVAAKVGAFGQLDLSYKIGVLYASGNTSLGGKFVLKGTIGLEAIVKFLFIKKRYVFCDAGFTYTYTHGDQTVFNQYGMAGASMQPMAVLPMSDYNPDGKPTGQYVLLDTGYELEDRNYLNKPQRWNGDKTMLMPMAAVDLGTITKSIQTNAYPYAYPLISSDNQIMVMLSDLGSTDINDTSVVFSKKDNDGNWPVQQAIDSTETTAGSNPSYHGNSSFGIATWENVKVQATEQIIQMADQTEIKAAVYNGSNWTSAAITGNAVPDMGPKVAVSGNRGVVLWQRTPGGYGDTDPMTGQAPAQLMMRTYVEGNWSAEIKLGIPELQVIKSYDVAMMSDGTVMVVYSYEKVGSVSGDVAGREIARLIIAPNGTAGNILSCTSDSNTDTNPKVMAKKLKINGVDKECFYVAWYNEEAFLDSQGKTAVKKDILLRVYDGNNEEEQILPPALNANRVSDDPEITENYNFIRSESDNPEDFGISWLLPYSQGETAGEYGIFAKIFAANGARLMLTAPIKVALSDSDNIIDAFTTNVTRTGNEPTLNVVYAKTQYNTDAAASTPENVYTQGQTDLYAATTLVKNTIGIDEVNFDRQGVFINAPTTISFKVRNKGIKEIQSLAISAGSQNFNTPVRILPNTSQTISVQYLNSGTIISPEFSLKPIYSDNTEGETALATVNLAQCDLEIVSIKNTNAGANGDYNFTITVRNKSQYKMFSNQIKLDLGIYEDVQRTTRAAVSTETGELDLGNIADEKLDSEEQSYTLSYHVEPAAYDQNGIKLLYLTLYAKDASGKVLEELSFDNNEGIVEFTDPKILYKEQFNTEIVVSKSPTDKSAVVTSKIENLYAVDAEGRLLLRATDTNGNITESKAARFTVSGSDVTDPIVSSFVNFGKRVDHEILLPEALGAAIVKQDVAASVPGKIILTAFGGSGSYEYSRDNGVSWQSSEVFDGLATGSYTVCVRDKNSPAAVSKAERVVLYSDQSTTTYTVSIATLFGGSITATPSAAEAGTFITLTITPDPGKRLEAGSLKYNDGDRDYAISETGFFLPAANVTVSAEFESIPLDECFIATAAFGSKFTPAVILLRHFRDQYLLTNPWGTKFVNFYYHNSPPIAAYIAHRQPLKVAVRVMLVPVIAIVYILYHPVMMGSILCILVLLIVYRLRVRKKLV